MFSTRPAHSRNLIERAPISEERRPYALFGLRRYSARAYAFIECPPELGNAARQEWNRLVPHLTKAGVLTEYDLGPLAIYCAAFGHWLEATEALQKYGTMIKSPNGYPIQSPYVAIANKQAEIMIKIASEFGFTPASRGRRWMMVTSTNSELLELEAMGLAGW